ncbi:histidine kinase [Pseudonocardia sp. NPDC049635]|uniref:sensor histidine kinase n=1 Tax=Pseudonocardia sp. NPDC049635 TaxID=3155506 RepID=UPI0033D04E51
MAGRTPRLLGAAALVAVLCWAAAGTPAFVDTVARPCPDEICPAFERPSPQAVRALAVAGIDPHGYAVAVAVVAWVELLLFLAVAAVLPWSRSARSLAAVTAVLLPLTAVGPFATALAAGSAAAWWADAVRAVAVAVLVPVFAGLFPDGRWHPGHFRRWWPLPALALVAGTPAVAASGAVVGTVQAVAEPLTWLLLAAVQVHRFRVASDWVARQQAKVLLVVLLLLALNAVAVTAAAASGLLAAVQPVVVLVDYAAFAVLGAGLAVALFRYRLYDVDLVLRRTVVYGGALAVLAVLYVGLVALAGSVLSGRAAPVLAGAAVGVLALTVGLAAYTARERLRRKLFGGQGLAKALAVVARDPPAGPGSDLAATIAGGLGLRHVQVLDAAGIPLWTSGGAVSQVHRESVVDADGTVLGTMLLAPEVGGRLDRHHRRVLAEVLPFVVLVLRAREEAAMLRRARTDAARAREVERRRLRRDLHDGIGPLLASQLLTLDTVRVAGERPELLAQLEQQARAAISEVRRVAQDLRPAALDQGGLGVALGAEAERLSAAGLAVTVRADPGAGALDAAAEVALWRIAQEALANVVRHAGARRARVDLAVGAEVVVLVVEDDGRGPGPAARGRGGLGGTTMRERATELGGVLTIGPGTDGPGTRVEARIPR